ncbi:MAG: hypothetical protein ABSB74_10100 [Tepidisphaeraceae bacterium]
MRRPVRRPGDGLGEVAVQHLPVMGVGDFFGVSQPTRRNVARKFRRQFGCPAGAKILEQTRPGIDASPPHDSFKLGPQIGIRVAVSGDNVLRARLGFGVHVQQRLAKLWKQRHEPGFLPLVVFGFRGSDQNPVMLKVDVTPFQRQVFRWTPKPAVAAQGKQQPPLCIGAGFQHPIGHVAGNEELAGLVLLTADFNIFQRTFGNHLPANRLPKHPLGCLRPLGNRRLGQLLGAQALEPLVDRQGVNLRQGLCLSEVS